MFIGIYDPLGAKTDRLRCEVCQNLILSPMNTGLLRPAVATAPTVHGIETRNQFWSDNVPDLVATAPTVHGIETHLLDIYQGCRNRPLQQHLPFTVLKHTYTLKFFC